MRYHEKLNIIIMRDNGPRRSFYFRRSRFYLALAFFVCLPFFTVLIAVQSWFLWQENEKLRECVERFEADYQSAVTKAERLENLEELLREQNIPAREVILRQLALDKSRAIESALVSQTPSAADKETENRIGADGPGHEEFPALDNGRVIVSNVQAKAIRERSLRIGLDLRNPDNEKILSGEVCATLITADGEKQPLSFAPQDVGNFRISRFKRTVIMAQAPKNTNLVDSQVIVEVKDSDGNVIYRNIFSVQQ